MLLANFWELFHDFPPQTGDVASVIAGSKHLVDGGMS
jgi:hypothetical protein